MALPPFAVPDTSYLSVPDADTLLALRWDHAPAWSTADVGDRERALMVASAIIRRELIAAGVPAGVLAGVPWVVQQATAEFAELLLAAPDVDPTAPGGPTADLAGIKSVTVGPIKLDLDSATSATLPGLALPDSVRRWLAPLLTPPPLRVVGSVPLVRSA